MKRTILVAARTQDRGAVAEIAAMRSYTASAGMRAIGPAAASAAMPAEVETAAPARPAAGLAGDVARGWRATAVRPGSDRGRRPRHV